MDSRKFARNLNIEALPNSDIKYAKKFLDERNFEALKELVDSAIIKIERGLKKDNIKEEYIKVNMNDLLSLQTDINIYLMDIDPNFECINYEEDVFNKDSGMDDDF